MNRKAILCAAMLSWAAVAAQAQTITVTAPNGGESWAQNTVHTITWTSTGLPAGQMLQIALWKDGAKVGDITVNASAAAGSYAWTVGSYAGGQAAPAAGYAVRVRVPGGVLDDSNAPFTITSGAPAATLHLTVPNGGESWAAGSTQAIHWSAANLPGHVQLILMQGAAVVGTIAQNIPSGNQVYNWTVGQHGGGSAPLGANYRIRVASMSSTLTSTSDTPFSIVLGALAGRLPDTTRVPLMQLPDLVICLRHHNDIHVPGSGTVPVRVKNIGTGASGPFQVRIHFEGDGTNHRDVPALAPGQIATVGRHEYWTLIAHKTITVEVDDDKKVAETNENNNTMQGTLHRTSDFFALEGIPFICSDGTTVQ